MIRRFSTIAMAGLFLMACGEQKSEQAAAPTPAPAPATQPAAPAPAAQPAAPAPAATAAPAPVPPAPAPTAKPEASRGATIYATNCSSCHGPKGDGDGPVGASLVPKPAKHSDGAYMNALTNDHLFQVIKAGGPSVGKSPMMAPWGGALSDAQIWDVIAFVRTLANPPYTGSVP